MSHLPNRIKDPIEILSEADLNPLTKCEMIGTCSNCHRIELELTKKGICFGCASLKSAYPTGGRPERLQSHIFIIQEHANPQVYTGMTSAAKFNPHVEVIRRDNYYKEAFKAATEIAENVKFLFILCVSKSPVNSAEIEISVGKKILKINQTIEYKHERICKTVDLQKYENISSISFEKGISPAEAKAMGLTNEDLKEPHWMVKKMIEGGKKLWP